MHRPDPVVAGSEIPAHALQLGAQPSVCVVLFAAFMPHHVDGDRPDIQWQRRNHQAELIGVQLGNPAWRDTDKA